MATLLERIDMILEQEEEGGEKWSGAVTAKATWHPKEGLFTKGATEIARYLKANSDSVGQAIKRLVFYKNRAGSNLPPDRIRTLNRALEILRKQSEAEKE